jgi:hypothetical protein
MLSPIIRYIRNWQRYGRDVQELSRWSDRELAELGLAAATSAVSLWGYRARARVEDFREEMNKKPTYKQPH